MNSIHCQECELPMVWRGSHVEWEGDYELERQRFECSNACMCTAEVLFRTFIPVDVARMRDA